MKWFSRPRAITITVNLVIMSIAGTWKATEAEQRAAWDLHVELATRIGVQFLRPDEGSLREALTSLYSIFCITRDILHRDGPQLAKAKGPQLSFAHIAVRVLNGTLRPFLTKWHPLLLNYEASRSGDVRQIEHERSWELYPQILSELTGLHVALRQYAELLAEAAGIPSLIVDGDPISSCDKM